MINVILWDVDNTLLDFPLAERHALQTCFARFGLGPCPPDRVARYSVLNNSYWKRLERGEITKEQLLTGRFAEFFAAEGIPFTGFADFNDAYQTQLGEQIFFLENSKALVEKLRGRVKQYAVTNGTRAAQVRKLEKSGLAPLLDGVFISEEIGVEKPNPAFFRAVRAAIGPYPDDEIMIVGDSLTSDMQGGSNAGILCCWYNPSGEPKPDNPHLHYVISSLWDVEKILDYPSI